MKKIFIFLVLLGAYTSSFAFLTQSNWRWRNNDGSQTTATWKAAQNGAITYNSIYEVLRLRVEIYNSNNNSVALEDSLQYTTTPADASSWKNILVNDLTRAFRMAGPNGFVVQNEPTTSQITGNAYTFVPGKVMVDTAVLKYVSIPPSNRSEYEWAIIGTPSTLPNTTYYFRHWGSTANNLPPGVTYPSLTTGAVLPIKLAGFSVKAEGKKVRLEWATESENNNDRFDIQRSADGAKWQTINAVKGKGSSASTTNYSADDNAPLTGVNYYRLQQFDLDGKSTFSDVKSVKMFASNKPVITVTPNPATSGINFKFENEGATDVLAVLSDANGKVIFKQTFKDVQPNAINKLNLQQQPTAGMYILQLKAAGLSQSIKVMVQ